MGKRIRVQRIGRGTQNFRTPPVRFAKVKIPDWPETRGGAVKGTVIDIVHEPGRYAPLALVKFVRATGEIEKIWMIASEGIRTGQTIEIGDTASLEIGNVLPLAKIPEGVPINNVEIRPYDGGKIARAAGTYAIIRSQIPAKGRTEIELPGKKRIMLKSNCRAQIGIVAGAGKDEKPLVKAGAAYHKWKVKAHIWPRTRGVAMNAVDHPFGGGRDKKPGKPKSVSRNAPPGRKVGSIAARRTGRRKK
ncbi:MAG: 50S ribosomal protein L2 [Candidatus Njordarchaeia archaeon]